MSTDHIAGTAIGVLLGVLLAHWLLALSGCAAAQPTLQTRIDAQCVVHGDGGCNVRVNEVADERASGGEVSPSTNANIDASRHPRSHDEGAAQTASQEQP